MPQSCPFALPAQPNSSDAESYYAPPRARMGHTATLLPACSTTFTAPLPSSDCGAVLVWDGYAGAGTHSELGPVPGVHPVMQLVHCQGPLVGCVQVQQVVPNAAHSGVHCTHMPSDVSL